MGKKDLKPRGKMSAYAFFVQTCREEHKKKHPNENVVFAEFSKKCAERWKTMSDKEKKRFHDMAEKDKARYEKEMSTYGPAKGEKIKGKKRKRTKDPNAPKRSLSAFFWYCQDERPKVRASFPDHSVGEIAKELGRRWNEVSEDTKSKYEALAAKDKQRYEKEVKAYKGKKAKGGGGGGGGGASPSKEVKKKKDDSEDEEDEESAEEEQEEEDAEEEDEEGDDDDDE